MSESKSEKRKTTIVVDEQYTIELTGRPGDRISQREFDVLQEVKKDPEIAAFGMSDKEIMLFMFPMKFDLTRTTTLIKNNKKWRKEHHMEHISRSDINPKLLASGNTVINFGARSKDGCSVCYLYPGRLKFKDYEPEEIIKFMIYFTDECYKNETLDAFRKGAAYVEDLHGVGLSSFDTGASKNLVDSFQNIFPQKITHIYIVNPPFILKALIALARLIVKQKIIKRTESVTLEKLHEYIDPSQLTKAFGGQLSDDDSFPMKDPATMNLEHLDHQNPHAKDTNSTTTTTTTTTTKSTPVSTSHMS